MVSCEVANKSAFFIIPIITGAPETNPNLLKLLTYVSSTKEVKTRTNVVMGRVIGLFVIIK